MVEGVLRPVVAGAPGPPQQKAQRATIQTPQGLDAQHGGELVSRPLCVGRRSSLFPVDGNRWTPMDASRTWPFRLRHFAAWEQPKLFSEEVRVGFRPLRKMMT
jgi:hypothetical protein